MLGQPLSKLARVNLIKAILIFTIMTFVTIIGIGAPLLSGINLNAKSNLVVSSTVQKNAGIGGQVITLEFIYRGVPVSEKATSIVEKLRTNNGRLNLQIKENMKQQIVESTNQSLVEMSQLVIPHPES